MGKRKRIVRECVLLWMALVLLGGPVSVARAQEAAAEDPQEPAREYTAELKLLAENGALCTDGNVDTRTALPMELALPADGGEKTLYLALYEQASYWLVQYDAEGKLLCRSFQDGPMLDQCFTLCAEAAVLRLSGAAWIAELRLFSEGALPDTIHRWEPTPQKADIMIISAHPDDEHLYLGGVMPTYAAERGYAVVLVFMTCGERVRHDEALEGAWRNGLRGYPVFLNYKDAWSETELTAAYHWGGREGVQLRLRELFNAYRPEVVITHDIHGEYGHGAHKLTAALSLEAVRTTVARPDDWKVQKLYWHLGEKNPITMDWRAPLAAFDGETAFDRAKLGYKAHRSQTRQFKLVVRDDGPQGCAKYGLTWTRVGRDVLGGDFLENIPRERLSH